MTSIRARDWKPIPNFNVLKWKAEAQNQVLWETEPEMMRDTENMTAEEVREYFRKRCEILRKKMEGGEKI